MAAGQIFALEATNTYQLKFIAATDTLQFLYGSTVNFAVNINNGNVTMASGATLTGGTGAFVGLSASGVVSGVGFSNYFASPPAIGGTTSNSASFTSLTLNAASSTYAVHVTGSYTEGIDMGGATISGNAIRLAAGQSIAFEQTSRYTLQLDSTTATFQFKNATNVLLGIASNGNLVMQSGASLQLGSAYTAGAPTATGYVTIVDSAGVTRKLLCA
jgi:hypothetical protein